MSQTMLGGGKNPLWIILAWVCVAVVSLVALKYAAIPYTWIFLSCSAALFAQAAILTTWRALWVNLAFAALTLGAFEYYLWEMGSDAFVDRRVDEGTWPKIFSPHDAFGWAPEAGITVSQKRSFDGEVFYDATYTIGSNGLRISSPSEHTDDPSQECILFFGGSFMFGQGIEDDETVPFLVNVASKNHYRTYNFGVSGYGATQMLTAFRYDLVDNIVECDPQRVTHVLYQGIPDHVRRAAGPVAPRTRGPRYRLTEDGSIVLDGRFEDVERKREDISLMQLIENQLSKSQIYKSAYVGKFAPIYDAKAIDLYLAVLRNIRDLVHSHYPGAKFHVLWWDEDNIDNRLIIGGLKQRNIDVHLMSEILPHYDPGDRNLIYRLHRRDDHPNALANALIARYSLREILR